MTETQKVLDRIEMAGAKAIGFSVDSAADGNRHRAARFDVGSADSSWSLITVSCTSLELCLSAR